MIGLCVLHKFSVVHLLTGHTYWTSCCTWTWIWRNASFVIFFRAGTKWLPPVSKCKETPPCTIDL